MMHDGDLGFRIAPIELLRLPSHLDGSLVPRFAPAFGYPAFDAANDLDAIEKWLGQFAGSKATHDRYRLEAERCLLWATVERGKPMCTLNDTDAHAYERFLRNLHPRDRWICVGHLRRDDPSWRPFQRQMSPRNLMEAIRILSGLWDWLEERGYLSGNPWRLTMYVGGKFDKTVAPGIGIEGRDNIVTRLEWSYLDAALNELEKQTDEAIASRARALFYLAYFGDIKPGELAELRISAITQILVDETPVWGLHLQRRPRATCEIALLPPAQQALEGYLAIRGIVLGTLEPGANLCLIASARSETSRQALHTIARPVFARASAMALDAADLLAARRLSHASLQWLRHAFEAHAYHQVRGGNAVWLLLGSSYLVPDSLHPFLPSRVPMQAQHVLHGFEQLNPMWQRVEEAESRAGNAAQQIVPNVLFPVGTSSPK